MAINIDKELNEIIANLKPAEGYLDCEKVIIINLKKHLANKIPVSDIDIYLKNLMQHFENLVEENENFDGNINYRYAAQLLNTSISTPYWKSWIHANPS